MKIAVLLPSYNHAKFIGEAIAAVRAQSHANWEIAIVDDASTDGSRDLIADQARHDKRITATFLSQNGGAVAALRAGYAMTTAPLVLGAAADDVIASPGYFAAVNAALAAHPQAACVFAKAVLVDAETGKEHFVMAKAPRAGFIAPRQCLKDFLTDRIFIHGAAVVWRRPMVDRVGGYDAALGPRADLFLNLAVPALAGAVFLDLIAARVRFAVHGWGRSADDETHFRQYALVERKLQALDLTFRIKPDWRRRWRDHVINERLANGWQRRFLDAVHKPMAAFDPWHLPQFQPDLGEVAMRLSRNAPEWEAEIDRRVAAAERLFESIAGPLQSNRFAAVMRRVGRRRERTPS
jgi:glycosyltransferase involved in cell wall biosynthesis